MQSALFNFHSFVTVVVLLICTCTTSRCTSPLPLSPHPPDRVSWVLLEGC
ncbi:hypothetical protein C2845_PM01G38170 [Panicum miliaceum]|uniref:Protein kish n=1 Tax=Panicum miliaceum TaxID=4540 RepID=A0A3L6TKX3_PANMI|nr:hypothetical protein C2845_PM01G38170 [Panicum miliaceum]